MKAWRHKVDEKWLEARDTVLSATDVCKLLPEWKRSGKKAQKSGDLLPGFAALWGEKHSARDRDPWSSGPAARGHIMEPYCVDAYTRQVDDSIHHWDDCLIRRGGIGFSPDGLDVKQPAHTTLDVAFDGNTLIEPDGTFIDGPTKLLEIKSYEPRHHFQCCIKDKIEQDEAMQIAVAMYVMPSLQQGTLVFYCPGAPIEMKVYVYTRDDLKDRIQLVEEIEKEWLRTCRKCQGAATIDCYDALYTEDEIYSDWIETQDQYGKFTE